MRLFVSQFRSAQPGFQDANIVAESSGFFVIFGAQCASQECALGLEVGAHAFSGIIHPGLFAAMNRGSVDFFEDSGHLRSEALVAGNAPDTSGFQDVGQGGFTDRAGLKLGSAERLKHDTAVRDDRQRAGSGQLKPFVRLVLVLIEAIGAEVKVGHFSVNDFRVAHSRGALMAFLAKHMIPRA
jgi:hypothetical protein